MVSAVWNRVAALGTWVAFAGVTSANKIIAISPLTTAALIVTRARASEDTTGTDAR